MLQVDHPPLLEGYHLGDPTLHPPHKGECHLDGI
jgi:hypothetical protein